MTRQAKWWREIIEIEKYRAVASGEWR